jgi:hypothetical protein
MADLVWGFRHDGEAVSVLPEFRQIDNRVDALHVKPSQFVDGRGEARPAAVELQGDQRTLAVMTPDEATDLALLAAADVVCRTSA